MKDLATINALLIVTGLGVALGLSEVDLRVTNFGHGSAPMESHPVLDHVNPRDYQFRDHDPGGEYGGHFVQYDPEGVVSDPAAEAGRAIAEMLASLRIGCFGDSFFHATQAEYERLFSSAYCAQLGGDRHPQLRCLQF